MPGRPYIRFLAGDVTVALLGPYATTTLAQVAADGLLAAEQAAMEGLDVGDLHVALPAFYETLSVTDLTPEEIEALAHERLMRRLREEGS